MSRVYYGVTNKDAETILEIQTVLTYNYPHSQATPHMHYMYFTFRAWDTYKFDQASPFFTS